MFYTWQLKLILFKFLSFAWLTKTVICSSVINPFLEGFCYIFFTFVCRPILTKAAVPVLDIYSCLFAEFRNVSIIWVSEKTTESRAKYHSLRYHDNVRRRAINSTTIQTDYSRILKSNLTATVSWGFNWLDFRPRLRSGTENKNYSDRNAMENSYLRNAHSFSIPTVNQWILVEIWWRYKHFRLRGILLWIFEQGVSIFESV